MAEHGDRDKREHPRLRLELPVLAQIEGSGFREFQIVDIAAEGLQLWSKSVTSLGDALSEDDVVTFEVRFDARVAWVQELEDGGALSGWKILTE